MRTPSPVDALPCGSMSTSRTRKPSSASAAATFTAVVVLPTPPFWLATAITLPIAQLHPFRKRRRPSPHATSSPIARELVLGNASSERKQQKSPRLAAGQRVGSLID